MKEISIGGVRLEIVGCEQEKGCKLPEELRRNAVGGLVGERFNCIGCSKSGVVMRTNEGYRIRVREGIWTRFFKGMFLGRVDP